MTLDNRPVRVRPYQTTDTTCDFVVQRGDGATGYIDVLKVNEENIQLEIPILVNDGSLGAPSIAFDSDNLSGVKKGASDGFVDVVSSGDLRFTVANDSVRIQEVPLKLHAFTRAELNVLSGTDGDLVFCTDSLTLPTHIPAYWDVVSMGWLRVDTAISINDSP